MSTRIGGGDADSGPSIQSGRSLRTREISAGQSARGSSSRKASQTKGATSTDRTGAGGDDDDGTDVSSDDSDDSSEHDELDENDRHRELSSSVAVENIAREDLVYRLEVIQQPQRARACGFGDKDRRPLSPPPIIQLRIFDKAGNPVSPNAIDCHRLILMVDLWNGDQTQQRSIVMHPGARQDQYALFTHTSSRQPSVSHGYSENQTSPFSRGPSARAGSTASQPPPTGWQGGPHGDWSSYSTRPPHYGHASSSSYPPLAYSGQAPPSWQQSPGHTRPPSASHPPPYGPPDDWHDARSASMSAPPPPPPPAHHDSRGWTPEGTPIQTPGDVNYPPERAGSGYPVNYAPPPGAEGPWRKDSDYGRDDRPLPPGVPGAPPGSGYADWDRHYGSSVRPWGASGDDHWSRQHRYSQSSQGQSTTGMPFVTSPTPTPVGMYPETTYTERMTTSAAPSASSHYSRVLVGSMGAVCQRLKDLDGNTGLFFFAHDLGIRTEGTFSLRFTLADLTALTVQTVVKDQAAPILAREFSSSFTVYSAKRFPGVLPTTRLTQCFADQSVRLPTRQKRTTPTSGSKRKK